MKLSELITKLQEIRFDNGDLDVCYCKDDEGNEYSKVYYTPTVGFLEVQDGFFISKTNPDYDKSKKPNYVCIT
jgi:hypothetical protein